MHDPLVVAFEIRRPWPKRWRHASGPSWKWGYGRGLRWRPSAFMNVAGVRLYWPALVTVWHVEPGGADSGTVCTWTSHWRWHVHHWRFQVHPLQDLRRWALTRCEWCGGKSRKGGRVNVSRGGRERAPWWRGELGLYHRECMSADTAWATCTCATPSLGEYAPGRPKDYGRCADCGRFRPWKLTPERAQQAEQLRESVPVGARPMHEPRNGAR